MPSVSHNSGEENTGLSAYLPQTIKSGLRSMGGWMSKWGESPSPADTKHFPYASPDELRATFRSCKQSLDPQSSLVEEDPMYIEMQSIVDSYCRLAEKDLEGKSEWTEQDCGSCLDKNTEISNQVTRWANNLRALDPTMSSAVDQAQEEFEYLINHPKAGIKGRQMSLRMDKANESTLQSWLGTVGGWFGGVTKEVSQLAQSALGYLTGNTKPTTTPNKSAVSQNGQKEEGSSGSNPSQGAFEDEPDSTSYQALTEHEDYKNTLSRIGSKLQPIDFKIASSSLAHWEEEEILQAWTDIRNQYSDAYAWYPRTKASKIWTDTAVNNAFGDLTDRICGTQAKLMKLDNQSGG